MTNKLTDEKWLDEKWQEWSKNHRVKYKTFVEFLENLIEEKNDESKG